MMPSPNETAPPAEWSAQDHLAAMSREAAAIAEALRHAWRTNEHMNEAHRYVARSFTL